MAFFERLRNAALGTLAAPRGPSAFSLDALLQLELTRELARLQSELRTAMPDNPAACGFKVYSQADEDGIIEEIARRVGIDRGYFIEIGCGDGRENNSHYLLLKGWRGIWVDGDPGNIAAIRAALPLDGRLRLVEQMVTRENVTAITGLPGLPDFGPLDLLSVDVDGNDLVIAEAAIEAWSPKIVVGEYNAKFPYPVVQEVRYDPRHAWAHDDYHGASLAAWHQRLRTGYQLVACNLAGTNAFFVRKEFADRFTHYPAGRLYCPARFYLTALRSGHAPGWSFLRNSLLADSQVPPLAASGTRIAVQGSRQSQGRDGDGPSG
jgi:hypothetical protein